MQICITVQSLFLTEPCGKSSMQSAYVMQRNNGMPMPVTNDGMTTTQTAMTAEKHTCHSNINDSMQQKIHLLLMKRSYILNAHKRQKYYI